MSDYPESGLHPDTDSLNAFVEGVLPEHERLRCLAHLADCGRCREIVFLAQEPQATADAADAAPGWRRWFAPIPVFGAMAAVGALAMAVWLYPHRTPPPQPVREVAEFARPAQPGVAAAPPAPVEIRKVVPAQPSVARKVRPEAPVRDAQMAPQPAPPPPPAAVAEAPAEAFQGLNVNQSPAPAAPAAAPSVADDGLSAVAGTVTDPAGAPLPGAAVTLRALNGAAGGNGRTDASGKFRVAGLTAGRYEVQIAAPGFVQSSKQIDLQARDVATLNSELKVGSVAETVEVTAASPLLQTESAARASAAVAPLPLPSKRPTVVTASSGKVMLSADSSGALFISRNGGKSWKSVKPVWHGKVVGVLHLLEGPGFLLTTDAGAIWLSRDGTHWQQAPAK